MLSYTIMIQSHTDIEGTLVLSAAVNIQPSIIDNLFHIINSVL